MIKQRSIILFLLALALGLGASIFANKWFDSRLNPIATAEAGTTPVVVAALQIPFGQKIEAAHVKTIDWPSDKLPADVFHDMTEIEGKIANQTIFPGEVLLSARIVDHTQGSTLSSIISPNKRAITVRVNDVIGVAGFLLPGNRVDVLATRLDTNRRAYTKTILEDLKVLAVDQTASPDKDKPLVVRAVTLEIDPKQAEELVKATQEGNVQLALRNPKDESRMAKAELQPKPVIEKRVTVRRTPAKRADNSVTVIRGTNIEVSKVKL